MVQLWNYHRSDGGAGLRPSEVMEESALMLDCFAVMDGFWANLNDEKAIPLRDDGVPDAGLKLERMMSAWER